MAGSYRTIIGGEEVLDLLPVPFKLEYANRDVARMLGVTPDTIRRWQDLESPDRLRCVRRARGRFVPHYDLRGFCFRYAAFHPAWGALQRAYWLNAPVPEPYTVDVASQVLAVETRLVRHWIESEGLKATPDGRIKPRMLSAWLKAHPLWNGDDEGGLDARLAWAEGAWL
jgi:hypothetical protein